MKAQNGIFAIIILVVLLFVLSCSKEHFTIEGDSKTIVTKAESFEIEEKAGKTIAIDYDLYIESGTVIFLMQDINNDTLLYQTHIRDLKGAYYITKADTNNYVCKIFTNNLVGYYNISCKSR